MPEAKKYLSATDAAMGRLISLVGKTQVRSEQELSVFQSLVRAIAYQMISTKAAAAIHQRLIAQCDNDLQPQKLLALGENVIRETGFSGAKTKSLLDLADKFVRGQLPDDATLDALDDKALTRRLTEVRGIGDWSVQMLMIFNLRRADVFPATDLGVRRGHMLAYGLDEMLDAKELRQASTVWQPYRSVAAWYLWRANDCVDWSSAAATDSASAAGVGVAAKKRALSKPALSQPRASKSRASQPSASKPGASKPGASKSKVNKSRGKRPG